MNIFQENYCRICSEFFCCESCRLNHEVNKHGIHPKCDICIYGKGFFRKPSESLLQHYKKAHWPLHCLICKTVFTSVLDLTLHNICPMAQKAFDQIPSTTFEENYDSPPIAATMHKSILTSSNKYYNDHHDRVWLTTSTPMQNFNERELLQHIPEVITPVEYSEKTNMSDRLKSMNASSVNSVTSEQTKDAEPPLKRRVTFSEIEVINIETPYQSRKTEYIPSYEIKSEIKQAQFCTTPGSKPIYKNMSSENDYGEDQINDDGGKYQMYVTANGEGAANTPKVLIKQEPKDKSMDLTHATNEDTEWQSALMESNISAAEVPSINSPKSDIVSPGLNENLTESNLLSPIISSDITSPIENQNSIVSEDIRSHMVIIVDENLANSSIFSLAADQNVTDIDSKLEKSGILSPDQNSYVLPNPDDLIKSGTNLEMFTPITRHFPTETQSPGMKSNLDLEIDKENLKYGDLESSTISGQTTGTNSNSTQKSGIWSSMANVFKTLMQGLSSSSIGSDRLNSISNYCMEKPNQQSNSTKRSKPEVDTSVSVSPKRKKIKLTHIQCRRTIRNVRPFFELKYGQKYVQTNEKGTQTD